MPARNLFVVDDDIGIRPSHVDARLFHRIHETPRRSGDDGKRNGSSRGQSQGTRFIHTGGRKPRRARTARKTGQWRQDLGRVGTGADIDDRTRTTLGALELHTGETNQLSVWQGMLGTTTRASG